MVYEIIAFVCYFIAVLGIGIFFFAKSKTKSEKDYFLGGRSMGGWVSALSAGASDMSAWVLMGLPGAIFAKGLGQVWISIGLLVGTIFSWVFVAPKLRRYAIKAGDSITIPQFLSNRFKTKSPTLRIASAIVFVFGYCIYSASSIYACGSIFSQLIPGVSMDIGMVIMAVIIVSYTLLGGFKAVCWTDFFQGLLMLGALMIVPIIASIMLGTNGSVGTVTTPDNYYNFLSSGKFDWASIASILTGFGWGLGYFGMPHILVRYMAVKSEKEMKKSRIIGIIWTALILGMATAVALIAREFLGDSYTGANNMVFVTVVRKIFGFGALALVGGILISAIVAASMSTADSQLLASSSAFASDIYKTTIKKDASDKEMMWVGRIAVIVVSIIALIIALCVYWFNIGGIMELVSAAWSIFGSAFGPVILLALFWRKFNYKGACVGIITGALVSVLWMILFNLGYYGTEAMPIKAVIYDTGLYEIVPGFVLSMLAAVITTKCTKAPSKEVLDLHDSVGNHVD